jgi:opacity protein-like surface antigen
VNHRARTGLAGLAAALVVAVTAASPASAADATITVPTDFVQALSDTRATGHYEVVGTGLHVWTEGSTSTDKVAEYVAAPAPLAVVGEPSLEYTPTTGTIPPGFQLVVDFDNDGGIDGILVGEPVYDGDWWLSNGSAQFVKDGAPSHTGGSGSANHGTLDAWRAAFPQAQVRYIGFSLGSGVLGDGVISALDYNGTRYTFAEAVVLAGKGDCKDGGWATSTDPVFRNQGDCVSHFASSR